MSSNSNVRSSEKQPSTISLAYVDIDDLKKLKVVIRRHNITDLDPSIIIQRNLENPAELKIHFRSDEGIRPIFDREDVQVNEDESRSVRRSGRYSRTPPRGYYQKYERTRRSRTPPEREHRTPQGYVSSRHSRTPPRSDYRKYERSRRSRTPPRREHRTPEGYVSSHHSRTPPRSDYRKYERSRRSRTPPRREHRTPEGYFSSRHRRSRSRSRSRDEKRYNPPSTSTDVPPEYGFYESKEYWISAPMPPRFIPRSYLPPPGAFPRGLPGHPILVPRMPMIMSPHPQFRPRLPVYNSNNLRSQAPSTSNVAGLSTFKDVFVIADEVKENDSKNEENIDNSS